MAHRSPQLSTRLHNRLSSSESTSHIASPSHPPRRAQGSHLQPTMAIPTPLSSLAPLRPSSTTPDRAGQESLVDDTCVTAQWLVEDAKRLMDHIEGHIPDPWTAEHEMSDPEGLPQALQRGIIIGEGSYKLDIARSSPIPSQPSEDAEGDAADVPNPTIRRPGLVSLYIATLILPSSQHYRYNTTIFVGIRPIQENDGQRFATPKWIWVHDMPWTFSSDTEYCEVQLPELSDVVANSNVDQANGFLLSVEIKSLPGLPRGSRRPDQYTISDDMIRGFRSLVDSATGDVRFVCLEHTPVPGDCLEGNAEIMSRKRVLNAHSEILRARGGDYFDALLTGGFSESEGKRGDNRWTTVMVDDAGFETVYWTIRFMYTNELIFADHNDIRALTKQSNYDKAHITELLTGTGLRGEWDYQSLSTEGDSLDESTGALTHKKGPSTSTSVGEASSDRDVPPTPSPATHTRALRDPPSKTTSPPAVRPNKSTVSPSPNAKSLARSSAKPGLSTTTPRNQVPAAPANQALSRPPSSAKHPTDSGINLASGSRSHYAPPTARHHTEPDPHAHPTVEPPPAQSLSVFMLAHRYRLDCLEALAKDNILGNLTADNCIPMLLATYHYTELHAEILDYVVVEWSAVQRSPEFYKGIEEFQAWGRIGVTVFHDLLRRV